MANENDYDGGEIKILEGLEPFVSAGHVHWLDERQRSSSPGVGDR